MKDIDPTTAAAQIISSYLNTGLSAKEARIVIRRAVKAIKQFKKDHPFHAIAFRGVSGSLVAPIIAYLLGVNLIVVRKTTEKGHTSAEVEGDSTSKYIIIDDFISSGDTIGTIMQEIKKCRGFCRNDCVGIYLWTDVRYGTMDIQEFESKFGVPLINPPYIYS